MAAASQPGGRGGPGHRPTGVSHQRQQEATGQRFVLTFFSTELPSVT